MIKKYLFLLVLLAIMFVACSNTEQTSDTTATIPVSVNEVVLTSITEPILVTGTVLATQDAVIKSKIEGYYKLNRNPKTNMPYKLGDWVNENVVIVELDNPQRINEIQFDAKKLEVENAEREFEKQKSLYEKGGVTLNEFKMTESQLIQARYAYENAVIFLSQFKITAPFSGFIVDLPYYTPGVLVSANSNIVQVMDYRKLLLTVNLPDKEMQKVHPKLEVLAYNYTIPNDTLKGMVTDIAPTLDSQSRTFKTNILIDNPNNKLRPGMFVKAEIIAAQKDSAIVIPKEIITSRRGSKTVFIVEKGAAQDRQIDTGLENRDYVEVINGLKVGDRLVVKGFETLREGSRVKIIK
ncbi:efflux RND transporter periplasmic adaptor subunit [candidate division KSB1 bacterium]|nr:efflux RND transporter periplasmic adaptor subunit [candidate division KSB1 bacterium]